MFLSRRGELIILPVASRVGRSFHGDWSSDSSRLRRLRRKEPLKSTIADRSFFLNGDSPRDFPSIFILLCPRKKGTKAHSPVCNRRFNRLDLSKPRTDRSTTRRDQSIYVNEGEGERESLVNYDREANLPSSIALLIRHSIRQTHPFPAWLCYK